MTCIQPFASSAEALDFAVAETLRGLSALARGDIEGAQMLFETASEVRRIADAMRQAACQ